MIETLFYDYKVACEKCGASTILCDSEEMALETWNRRKESKMNWILTSDKMPKPRQSVLLSVNSKYGDWVGEGCYWETTENHVIWKGYRWNATYWDDEIIAWMPLPRSYGEREGE